jgi:SAM-dependent methyltransferase
MDLEMDMFQPSPLHPDVLVADVYQLPFKPHTFDLITATNLIFLLAEPVPAMRRIKQCLSKAGRLAMLNPSEALNPHSALRFVDEKGLVGVGRDTFLQWARRAEEHHHWTETETSALYREAGMECAESVVKVGPGFARFSWGQ